MDFMPEQPAWVITIKSAVQGYPIEGSDCYKLWFESLRQLTGVGGEIAARNIDDGLPCGFLVGAIVEVWVALRLNWACELPLSRGEVQA
jgi:hypothetical protein